MESEDDTSQTWLQYLDDEDLAFIRRFVLLSGSLKDTARAYGVSYPTVRLRLDRLIAKIQVIEDATVRDPFERVLRAAFAEGKLDPETFSALLQQYWKTREA